MVNINIKKKDLWLLSVVMVFLVGITYIIAYNPTGIGGTPSIMGHSADEIEGSGSGILGTYRVTGIERVRLCCNVGDFITGVFGMGERSIDIYGWYENGRCADIREGSGSGQPVGVVCLDLSP